MFRTRIAILVLVSAFSVHALEPLDRYAPHFDPTPVQMPEAAKAKSLRAITTSDLLNLRDIKTLQMSPDGTAVALVIMQADCLKNIYRTGLWVVGTKPGSVPIILGNAGEPRFGKQWEAPEWTSDSRSILYRLREGGTWEVWKWHREGGPPLQVTHSSEDVVSFRFSKNGNELVYTTQAANSPRDLARIAERGILYDGTYRFWEGRSLAEFQLEKQPIAPKTWVYDFRNNVEHLATKAEAETPEDWLNRLKGKVYDEVKIAGNIFTPTLSPDGKRAVYRLKVHDPGTNSSAYPLYVQHLDGGEPIELTPGAFWVSEFWWSNDSQEIYFKEFEVDGRSTPLQAVPADGGSARVVFQSEDHLTQLSPDDLGLRLACLRENSVTPPELAVIELKSPNIRTLLNVNPEFQNIELSPATRIEWKNEYGEAGFGQLIKPLQYRSGHKYPLIVTTYGSSGEFLRGAVGDEYPIQVFAAHGFAVLDFDNNRQYENRPGDFDGAIRRLSSPLSSLKAAVQVLDHMGIIDRSRIGISGLSHGAEISLFAISHSDLFKTAIVSGGDGNDPFFYYLNGHTWWHEAYERWGLAGWPEAPDLAAKWHQLSTAMNADRIGASLLINVSESEYLDVVKLKVSLEELHKPVEMFVYADELHVKDQPAHRREIYERNVDWFRFWLQDFEDPDAVKHDQYVRWQALKSNY